MLYYKDLGCIANVVSSDLSISHIVSTAFLPLFYVLSSKP